MSEMVPGTRREYIGVLTRLGGVRKGVLRDVTQWWGAPARGKWGQSPVRGGDEGMRGDRAVNRNSITQGLEDSEKLKF